MPNTSHFNIIEVISDQRIADPVQVLRFSFDPLLHPKQGIEMRHFTILLFILSLFFSGCAHPIAGPISGKKYWGSLANSMNSDWGYWNELRQQYVQNHPERPENIKQAILTKSIMIGMNAEEVKRSWPHRTPKINRSVGAWGVHEQWVYRRSNYKAIYVYFENGIVTSWNE